MALCVCDLKSRDSGIQVTSWRLAYRRVVCMVCEAALLRGGRKSRTSRVRDFLHPKKAWLKRASSERIEALDGFVESVLVKRCLHGSHRDTAAALV